MEARADSDRSDLEYGSWNPDLGVSSCRYWTPRHGLRQLTRGLSGNKLGGLLFIYAAALQNNGTSFVHIPAFASLFMPINVHWMPRLNASYLFAAHALAQGMLLRDEALAAALEPSSKQLRQTIASANLPAQRFWRNLLGLCVLNDGHFDLAQQALAKTVGRNAKTDGLADELAGLLGDLERAFLGTVKDAAHNLQMRMQPIQQQWEARGPGLTRLFADTTDPNLVAEHARVAVVYPVLGGGGRAFLDFNTVCFEGVLADELDQLPEVVRLAWLLMQLNCELPMYSEAIHGNRLPHIAALATIPPILFAAEQVQLARCDEATVEQALTHWHLTTPVDVDPVQILMSWWTTYLDTRSPWHVALAALDRMFG